MQLDLQNTQWDYCVVGNGVSALWASHWLWSKKKNVVWVTSEEPYSSHRAMLQHSWLWNIDGESSQKIFEELPGFEIEAQPFQITYFDAKSSKRFRNPSEIKLSLGSHEKDFLNELINNSASSVDAWAWHAKIHQFHDTGAVRPMTSIELFSDPRFVRVQAWPVLELKTEAGKISEIILAQGNSIRANQFLIGDFDEYLPTLIRNETDSQILANCLKGRTFQAGFGLRLWHKPQLENTEFMSQTAVIPLVANPSGKNDYSHVVGRFIKGEKGWESFWIGLLTDEEVEDNNEILKKIKQAKRAVDRAIPGFQESIEREAVTFEPKMYAKELVKNRKREALGAFLISDFDGPQTVIQSSLAFLSNSLGVSQNVTVQNTHVRGADLSP